MERDLLPMCREEGMAIAPWGAIGQGRFQRKADVGKSKDGRSAQKPTDDEAKVSAALEVVADELGVESITAVALAYTMAKVGQSYLRTDDTQYPYCYPIVGGRKIEHLKQNITGLDIKLTQEQVMAIDGALVFDYGQPQSQFGLDPHMTGYQQHPSIQTAGLVDYVPHSLGIDMSQGRSSDKEVADRMDKYWNKQ
jgi:aryl-alcohol dehydrogenase-like predicted oxidoreductase